MQEGNTTIYLFYRNKFAAKPDMCFLRESDAREVCDAWNDAHASIDDSDIWLAYIEPMPLVGCGW